MSGEARNVRVGPGTLYVAPVGSLEPGDLIESWPVAWVPLGYTHEGSNFVFNQTFSDVVVAEELDPIDTLQTARTIDISFALAELTAQNLQIALNGGSIGDDHAGTITFEPPDTGEVTYLALGWEATDGLERWIYRRCVNTGNIDIARRRAPDKATIPISFRATKPSGSTKPWVAMFAEGYQPVVS